MYIVICIEVIVKFATLSSAAAVYFLYQSMAVVINLPYLKPISYLIFKHMRKFYWQGLSEGNLEQAQLNKTNFKKYSMTTLPTTCITNSNQKLKNRKKNSTQLDAHGSSDKCCHYTK